MKKKRKATTRARMPTQTRTVMVMLTGELPRVDKKLVEEAVDGAAEDEVDAMEDAEEAALED